MPTDITKLPLREVLYAGRTWKTGRPIRFQYRETRLWPETPLDPAGEWLTLVKEDEKHDGWLRFRRPIVLEWGAWRGTRSWVRKLWKLFHQRKGPAITRMLQRLRYDGIVTVRWDRPYQILNLTGTEAPWFLHTPGILRLMEQCRTLYTKEFANLNRQYHRTSELLASSELTALFEQHLEVHELQDAHEALWGAWEASTRSHPALHLCGLLSNLGVSGRPLEGDSKEHRQMGTQDKDILQVVEHQYAFLQVLLEQAQRKTAKVYRGIRTQKIHSRWLTASTREASSWSLSLSEVQKKETTLGAVVPVERLLLVPGTRLSSLFPSKAEVVVLGSPDIVNVRWEHPDAKQAGRQMLDLGRRDEDWLARHRLQKSARRIASAHQITQVHFLRMRLARMSINLFRQKGPRSADGMTVFGVARSLRLSNPEAKTLAEVWTTVPDQEVLLDSLQESPLFSYWPLSKIQRVVNHIAAGLYNELYQVQKIHRYAVDPSD